ncbi:MAG TPA: N-6 DNA methylase [Dehalococcoidia bacterium]|nr:N-6 DNA methylase [Dehalococcoidia bacterium]
MVFQEVLSTQDKRVDPLRKLLRSQDPVSALATQWDYISLNIDYVPIFRVARDLLLELPGDKDVTDAVSFLGEQALSIVSKRAALKHDLMGRVYHRLLVEAKFLGTYYTSVPAATLLLKLALGPKRWKTDWASIEELKDFRVADLACGTGTLLMAAAEALSDNYVNAASAAGASLDLARLHQSIIEDVIFGYDVLPSALHLTASTLALRSSSVAFGKTNLFSLPLGGHHKRLGSVEFLRSKDIALSLDLFGTSEGTKQVTGKGDVGETYIRLPDIDLCVMNPPFTRSVGGNLCSGPFPSLSARRCRRISRQS